MKQVLQRLDWHGESLRQGETFRLKKKRLEATCELWSHPFGWELRLATAGELLRSEVCRSQHEVLNTSAEWKSAMASKGWRQ